VTPRWDSDAARDLWGVAVASTVSSLSYQGFRNVDYVIVAAKLGAAQAGFYWRAFQLGVEYQRKITIVMAKIALPVYSRTQNLDHMRQIRTRIVRINASLLFPFFALFIAVAPVLVPWLYGPQWEPAIVPAQILAGAGMVMALSTGMGPLVTAAGRTRALAWWNLILLVGYGATVFVSASMGGLVTVCGAVTTFYVVQLLVFHYFLLQRLVGIPVHAMFSDAGAALVGSVALVALALPTVMLLDSADIPVPVTLVGTTLMGGAAYVLTLRGAFSETWKDLVLLARRAVPRLPGRWRTVPGDSSS
jgi:O-antigen/teichoic acid export membrane protein